MAAAKGLLEFLRSAVDGSGCYGRNGHEDAAADAALLARAAGRPVRVQWMRADEHGWDPKGPPTLIDLHGGLDGDGQPRRGQEPDRGNIVQTTILF